MKNRVRIAALLFVGAVVPLGLGCPNTQKGIQKDAEEMKEKAADAVKDAKKAAGEAMEKVGEAAGEAAEKVAEGAEAVQKKAEETKKSLEKETEKEGSRP